MSQPLSWKLVDEVADKLGVTSSTRLKWRQPGRGVPPKWQIEIAKALMSSGVPVSLADFEQLEPNPGRIAA